MTPSCAASKCTITRLPDRPGANDQSTRASFIALGKPFVTTRLVGTKTDEAPLTDQLRIDR